jgi:hypothetical protein
MRFVALIPPHGSRRTAERACAAFGVEAMMALLWRVRRRGRFKFALALLAGLAAAGGGPASAADVIVVLDQAKVMRIPERTATVVVGNPLIADISVQTGGLIVVTGKGYGVTNFIALDTRGNTLVEQSIEVRGPNDHVVVVHRGIERESYSCTPKCERRLTLGDTPAYFDATLAQSGNRASQAQGTGAANESRGR